MVRRVALIMVTASLAITPQLVAAQTTELPTTVEPSEPQVASQALRPRPDPAEMKAWGTRTSTHIRSFVRARKPTNLPQGRHTAVVNLEVDGSGRLLVAEIKQSSGRPDLDAAALRAIKDASPVPAPPSSGTGDSVHASLPVTFANE